jgi:hypothetical protein
VAPLKQLARIRQFVEEAHYGILNEFVAATPYVSSNLVELCLNFRGKLDFHTGSVQKKELPLKTWAFETAESLRWAKIFDILKEAQFRVRPGCSETTLQSDASAISSVEIAALNVSYIRDGIHSRRR